MAKSKLVYKILFYNRGELYEIYAREIYQGSLYGFVEVEKLLFGEKSSVVVDPSEERLKTEFQDVKRVHIPAHAIVRIDEVEKEGVGKIKALKGEEGNVMSFPVQHYRPGSQTDP